MSQQFLKLDQLCVEVNGRFILEDITFKLEKGASLAIIGPSGSGKTILGKVLANRIAPSSGTINFSFPSDFKSVFISQQHDFRDASERSYYQQRFDSNYGKDFPLVEEELLKAAGGTSRTEIERIAKQLRIDQLLKRTLIELSNGEGKRLQIARALLQKPELIIFDSPFVGLDTDSRKVLHSIINEMTIFGNTVVVITTHGEIPDRINHVLKLKEGKIEQLLSLKEFKESYKEEQERIETFILHDSELYNNLYWEEQEEFKVAVQMHNVSVSYGDKSILENINWKVNKGECWALLGHNGSGKSTLLSLINGDNPQAYGNDIWLFDKKKGSGESIWELKAKIGYISPELHIFFQRNKSFTETLFVNSVAQSLAAEASSGGVTVFDSIASGFNDQVGSTGKISSWQTKQVNLWIEILKLSSYRNMRLPQLPLGVQRLVLLGRALVKNPQLLILDEPCQGLDRTQVKQFVSVVNEICTTFSKTLIYVSHYKEDIPACVKNYLELENGKIKQMIN
ncbi:ABC-type molybdenum transport system, ATPase component/photorepair protein PhrA [Sporocytophaga myxococcoides]|uniref:ABC-type molybdenum transport system, ATPase component/photorepair protein PhrA n=1 Tax=Sporocytophaga myxococcoides TaxID=153721 RepID=A0A098LHM1_9BACT|nr:ATP-binding cassette domain-containing protein [Sporocytophaga myxococcoides]GAL86481.1 ABC-type molybdenum transport system, ATPase component/photorepair protein PhrA [Sporocytophaga myxococcoides]